MTGDEHDNSWHMMELTGVGRLRWLDIPSFTATLQPSFCLLPPLHFSLLFWSCLLLSFLGGFGFGWLFDYLCLFFCLLVHVRLFPSHSLPSLCADFLNLVILLFWITWSSTRVVVSIPVILSFRRRITSLLRCFASITCLLRRFSTGPSIGFSEAVAPYNNGTVYLMMVWK